MNPQESQALMAIAALASRADGAQVEAEAREIEAIAAGLAAGAPGTSGGIERERLPELSRSLMSPEARSRAYETAVAVCDADGSLTEAERGFLAELARELGIERSRQAEVESAAGALATAPLSGGAAPANEAELERMIQSTAILCGGLELLPQGLASLAILPIQMRMVYKIGKLHGYELDRGHLKEFLATVGLGLTAQYLEGFARRVVGGLVGRLSGGFLRGLAGGATGSAFTFASTHALGRLAARYYAGGRKLSAAEMKSTFASLFSDSQRLAGRHEGDMRRRAGELNVAELLPLVRGS